MRIAVLGATGMAGRAIVTEALARDHRVTALSRRLPEPSDQPSQDRLTARAMDVSDLAELTAVLADVDVAVLTVRLAPGDEHRLAALTCGVLDAAARTRTRVLVVGGSAPLRSPNHPDRRVIEDPAYVPPAWTSIARASLDQFHACHDHPYTGWTYLSPPAVLEPGHRAGGYRRGTTTLLTDAGGGSRITAPDLAIAVLDELEQPTAERHFTVVEAEPVADPVGPLG